MSAGDDGDDSGNYGAKGLTSMRQLKATETFRKFCNSRDINKAARDRCASAGMDVNYLDNCVDDGDYTVFLTRDTCDELFVEQYALYLHERIGSQNHDDVNDDAVVDMKDLCVFVLLHPRHRKRLLDDGRYDTDILLCMLRYRPGMLYGLMASNITFRDCVLSSVPMFRIHNNPHTATTTRYIISGRSKYYIPVHYDVYQALRMISYVIGNANCGVDLLPSVVS